MLAHRRSYALTLRSGRNHVAAVAHVRPEAWLVGFDEVGSEHLPFWRARDIGCRRTVNPDSVNLGFGTVWQEGIGVTRLESGAQDGPYGWPVCLVKAANRYHNTAAIRSGTLIKVGERSLEGHSFLVFGNLSDGIQGFSKFAIGDCNR